MLFWEKLQKGNMGALNYFCNFYVSLKLFLSITFKNVFKMLLINKIKTIGFNNLETASY